MRRPQSHETRNQVNTPIVLDLKGQLLDVGRLADQPQLVTEPLYRGPAHENTPLDGIGHLLPDLPGDGAQQLVLREDGLAAGVHHHKTAGAVSVLDHALLQAHLSEQGRLLVPGDAAQGNLPAEELAGRGAVNFTAGTHFRKQ